MDIVQSYVAQLYLRKQLNRVHDLLYNPNPDSTHRRHYQTMHDATNEIQAVLGDARDKWVPPSFSWNDDDPPPKDILAARLRAKYWGSQVILYRPFLRSILDAEAQPPLAYQNEHATGMNEKITEDYDPRTIQNARLAIRALIESTRAFHGIDTSKQRIIVTNIFGTAHA